MKQSSVLTEELAKGYKLKTIKERETSKGYIDGFQSWTADIYSLSSDKAVDYIVPWIC